MAMNLAPLFRQRHFDSNGDPLSGGKLYTYQAGTSTPQSTYTDSSGGTANANPVVLDASGYAPVWLDPALSYKVVLKDSNDVTIFTEDNVVGLLTSDSVATASIQDGAITTAKIADDAVTADKLKDDASVDGNRAVTTNHIRDSAITTAKIADNAVTRAKVAGETIGAVLTATATGAITDEFVRVSGSVSAWTYTLPDATLMSGKRIKIKRTDHTVANLITIAGASSQTIDGSANKKMATQYEMLELESDGSNWQIVNWHIPRTVRTDWAFTINGKGAVSGTNFTGYRDGEFLVAQLKWTNGTVAASTQSVQLPSGLTVNSSRYPSTATQGLGTWVILGSASATIAPNRGGYVFFDGSTTDRVFTTLQSASNVFLKVNGNNSSASSDAETVEFRVAIAEWAI